MLKYILSIFIFVTAFTTTFTQIKFGRRLADSTLTLTAQTVKYNTAYVSISYPNGDVPANTGVCTDVIIRAYRKLGIDLQKEVHEDMKAHFSEYPNNWKLKIRKFETNYVNS